MDIYCFAVMLTMVLVAALIVTRPILRTKRTRHDGFSNIALLAVIVIVLAAIGLYAVTGRPDLVAQNDGQLRDPQPAMSRDNGDRKAESVSSLLTGLEERLEREPGDGKGWLLLAKSYQHLGRHAEASDAYERAKALGVDDAAFENKLVEKSLGSPAGTVRGTVSLSAEARSFVAPDDVVFVIAKSADGNPMPLAVIRRPASDLPFDFVLDESASMLSDRGLAEAGTLTVTAKISKTGDAMNTADDLGAESAPVRAGDGSTVDLVIKGAADSPEAATAEGE